MIARRSTTDAVVRDLESGLERSSVVEYLAGVSKTLVPTPSTKRWGGERKDGWREEGREGIKAGIPFQEGIQTLSNRTCMSGHYRIEHACQRYETRGGNDNRIWRDWICLMTKLGWRPTRVKESVDTSKFSLVFSQSRSE